MSSVTRGEEGPLTHPSVEAWCGWAGPDIPRTHTNGVKATLIHFPLATSEGSGKRLRGGLHTGAASSEDSLP